MSVTFPQTSADSTAVLARTVPLCGKARWAQGNQTACVRHGLPLLLRLLLRSPCPGGQGVGCPAVQVPVSAAATHNSHRAACSLCFPTCQPACCPPGLDKPGSRDQKSAFKTEDTQSPSREQVSLATSGMLGHVSHSGQCPCPRRFTTNPMPTSHKSYPKVRHSGSCL
jgi:hypothetical protein